VSFPFPHGLHFFTRGVRFTVTVCSHWTCHVYRIHMLCRSVLGGRVHGIPPALFWNLQIKKSRYFGNALYPQKSLQSHLLHDCPKIQWVRKYSKAHYGKNSPYAHNRTLLSVDCIIANVSLQPQATVQYPAKPTKNLEQPHTQCIP